MSIIRIAHRSRYTTVANSTAQDSRLSFEARGVLLYLLSKPDDWEIRFSDVEREGGIGRDKRQRIFNELETFGYFQRTEVRGDDGCFDYDYVAYETSQLPLPDFQVPDSQSPQPGLPVPDLPAPDFQVADIRRQIPEEQIPEGIQKPELLLRGEPITIFKEYFPQYSPTSFQHKEILDTVRHPTIWRQACKYWAGNNYQARSVSKLLEMYKREVEKAANPTANNSVQVANDFDSCPICENGVHCPIHGGNQ